MTQHTGSKKSAYRRLEIRRNNNEKVIHCCRKH